MELREKQKEQALKILKQLDIYRPYIKGFKDKGNVCWFENYAGFWAYQDEELMEKIREFEQKHNALVYAVSHDYTDFGDCFSLLYISAYEEDWDYTIQHIEQNKYYVASYVWNKTDDWCSEFGDIAIISAFGGIKRIG